MVDSTNGTIVEPGQAVPLAAAIGDVLSHLEAYNPQQIAEAAAARYGYEAIAEAIGEAYESLRARTGC